MCACICEGRHASATILRRTAQTMQLFDVTTADDSNQTHVGTRAPKRMPRPQPCALGRHVPRNVHAHMQS